MISFDSSLPKNIDGYSIIKEIGYGTFGSIYKVSYKENTYVIKKISLGHLPQSLQASALNEVKILQQLKH